MTELKPKVELIFERPYSNNKATVVVHEQELPSNVARFAFSLIEKWGLVAGRPDGEDSAGRSRLGLMPANEIVTRAFDTAEIAWTEAQRRGWMLEVPDWKTVQTKATENEEK